MKKVLTILGVAGLSLTMAACATSDTFTGGSSLSVECRTAGFECDEANGVAVNKSKAKKADKVFSSSMRK